MNNAQLNTSNPAIRRILTEIKKLRSEPSDEFDAYPADDNLFDWHFLLRGPEDTPFAGGLYHGRIILPAQYPYKPPEFMFLCPTGRFEVGKKICLSISQHHPELWQPGWDIRTALTAIQSFMPTAGNGAIAALDYNDDERRRLAEKSREASTNSLRTHGMLDNFEEFLRRPRLASAASGSPAARGPASAPQTPAAATAAPDAATAAAVGEALPAVTLVSAAAVPTFGTPSPSPSPATSAASSVSDPNASARTMLQPPAFSSPLSTLTSQADLSSRPVRAVGPSSTAHAASDIAREAARESGVASWSEAAAELGVCVEDGGAARTPDAAAKSGATASYAPVLAEARAAAAAAAAAAAGAAWSSAPQHAPAGAGAFGLHFDSPSAAGSASGAAAGAANAAGHVRQPSSFGDITTAPPTPVATPAVNSASATPATPNSSTSLIAGARWNRPERAAVGGAAAAGRNLQMQQEQARNAPLPRRLATTSHFRNLPPPTEDEVFLATATRFLIFLLVALALRRGAMWAFPDADWHQVALAIWQEYLSLSETACSLFNEQAWEGGGGGAGLGGGEL